MSAGAGRRRAIAVLSLALASGGLAASEVRTRTEELEARVGPLVPAVVAREEIDPGRKLGPKGVRRLLAIRQVPERFRAPDALASPAEAIGLRTAVAVPAGAYVTAAQLEAEGPASGPDAPLRPGERALEVGVRGGESLAAAGGPAARVDVLVTTEPRSGAGRTFLALENVELLALRPGEAGGRGEGAVAADAVATLRLSVRQAVFLTAAQSFAREVRLLARPASDARRSGHPAFAARDL